MREVSCEPQRGQVTCSSPNNARRPVLPFGGAMPKRSSLALPSWVIQSVVQAGDSTRVTLGARKPALSSASPTSTAIMSMAGQPEWVDVMIASPAPFSARTSRSTPRSAIVSTGISGSTTAAATAHARERRSESLDARVIVGTASPSRLRIGALQELQLGEDVAEVLAVTSGAAAGLHPFARGEPQVRLGQDGGKRALASRADPGAV